MNPIEMSYHLRKLPPEQRVKVRRKMCYLGMILSIIALIGTLCLELYKDKQREKAVYLVTSEHYALVCNGVEKNFTLHDYVLFSTEDLSEYNAFRFIEETRTVRCSGSGLDLSGIILHMSIIILIVSAAILALTEFMSMARLTADAENKEDNTDEK